MSSRSKIPREIANPEKRAFRRELLDELLGDYKTPEDLIGESGLLKEVAQERGGGRLPGVRRRHRVVRPEGMEDAVRSAVKPGAFPCGDGTYVWWDPATLPLEVSEAPPAKQTQWLEAEGRSEGGSAAEVAAWEADRAAAQTRGAVPSLRPVVVTTVAAEGTASIQGVTVEG